MTCATELEKALVHECQDILNHRIAIGGSQ